MVGEAQQQAANVVVLDTSFLISNSQGHYWTLEPANIIRNLGSKVVIPKGVAYEYNKLMSETTLISFIISYTLT